MKPMSGEEIAQELGITRQAVSNLLKRAMRKCYRNILHTYPDLSPVAASILLMKWLEMVGDVEFKDFNEVKKFNRLFPPDVRKEIEKDMKDNRRSVYTIMEDINDILEGV